MDQNLKAYNSSYIVKWYEELSGMDPAEKKVLEQWKDAFNNAQLLDIGIGGGRTTAWLSRICKNYTGIDYSEKFAALCKKKFPGLDIRHLDARDLGNFADQSFNVVNFSYNGIDYVNADDREKILREIYRVLKPDGMFFFSTHNLNHSSFNKVPWLSRSNSLIVNLKTFVKLLPYLFRKRKNKKLEIINAQYAVINDHAHAYSLLTFYTSPAYLRSQLSSIGFQNIRLLSRSGEETNDTRLDEWIFVTCKKPN
jgi:ubiquinone/menaquinone biosynthesis C-methylase UbiE